MNKILIAFALITTSLLSMDGNRRGIKRLADGSLKNYPTLKLQNEYEGPIRNCENSSSKEWQVKKIKTSDEYAFPICSRHDFPEQFKAFSHLIDSGNTTYSSQDMPELFQRFQHLPSGVQLRYSLNGDDIEMVFLSNQNYKAPQNTPRYENDDMCE